jgi:hypothetical protein
MTHAPQPSGTDLDAPLEALDEADNAVRALYLKLAEDPDLAPEHEGVLRELHAKRAELAHRVGLAALAEWRAAHAAVEPTATAMATTTPLHEEPVVAAAVEHESNGVASWEAVPHEPSTPASPPEPEPTPSGAETAAVASVDSAPVAESPPSSAPISSPPASDAQLAEWKRAVESRGLRSTLKSSAPPQRPWGVNLHEMMCLLGPPEVDLNDSVALLEELDALDEVATPERQKLWVRLPIEVQKRWLSHLVARTRAIREHPSSERILERLKRIRGVYPEWAREYVPGHINGLQLKHAPIHGTWAKDAEDHWRALDGALGPDCRCTRDEEHAEEEEGEGP